MYLFFDTETTGLPLRWNAPVSDLSNWPRAVQIAWAECSPTGAVLKERSFLIRPDGYSIPKEATRIHGITTARAKREGVPLLDVLKEFVASVATASTVVAHNLAFDESVVAAECLRQAVPYCFDRLQRVCTMKASTEYCRIPGPHGCKWPTLEELHQVLFAEAAENAHDAASDVRACVRCYFELKRRRVIR